MTSLAIQAATAIQGIVVARLLGPTGRGEYAAILLWPSFFGGLALLGVNIAVARFAGRFRDSKALYWPTIRISLLTGVITALVCYFLLPFLVPAKMANLIPLATIFLLFIPINTIAINFLGISQGMGNFRLMNFSKFILYPVYLLGLVITLFFSADKLKGAVIALLFANTVVAFVRVLGEFKNCTGGKIIISQLQLVRDGFKFYINSLFSIVNNNLEQILLTAYLTVADLGIYVVARSAANFISVLPTAIGAVSFTQATQSDVKEGFSLITKSIRRCFILSMLSALLFIPILYVAIPLMYGDFFSESIYISLLLLIGIVFSGLNNIFEQVLQGHGYPLAGISARFVGILLFSGFGYFGTNCAGSSGLAIAYTVSQITICFLFVWIVVRIFNCGNIINFIPDMKDVLFCISNFNELFRKIVSCFNQK